MKNNGIEIQKLGALLFEKQFSLESFFHFRKKRVLYKWRKSFIPCLKTVIMLRYYSQSKKKILKELQRYLHTFFASAYFFTLIDEEDFMDQK